MGELTAVGTGAATSHPTWDGEREQRRVFRSRFPDPDAVFAGLAAVFADVPDVGGELVAIERRPNEWRSTFPSEIVACRFADGQVRTVLCKYGLSDYVSGHGHRWGVEREAAVYQRILGPLGHRPRCFGVLDDKAGHVWLVLEFIDGVPRLELAEADVPVLALAAEWSGRFHADTNGRVVDEARTWLGTYDAAYYAGWCERTIQYAGPWAGDYPWLPAFCRRFAEMAPRWLGGADVVVHGEYTPHNVVIAGGAAFPVDWESAALGAGEIDLASLTDQWPGPLVADAIAAYRAARWPGGAPAEFEQRLAAARAYWVLRWLGNRPELTTRDKNRPRFELLRGLGDGLGLL